MKINIKKEDCKFIVKPEDRMVICVIDGKHVRHLFTDFVEDFDFPDLELYMPYPLARKLLMPSSFMGKAVCAPEDEWNEETGRKIAYFRAKHKLYTSFFKRANLYVQTIDRRINDIMNQFNDLGEALSENQDKLEQEIEKLTKE